VRHDGTVGAWTFGLVLTPRVTTACLLAVFPVAIALAWLLFVSARVLGHLERARYAALLDGRLVDPVPPLRERGWWRRLGERVRSLPRWREILHLLIALPLGVLTSSSAVIVWSGSAALALLPLYVRALPGDS